MTDTYAPRLNPQQLLNSIYYWVTPMNTWAPGIAFPSGPNVPPNDENAHNNDFFYETDRNRLWRHDGDGASGSWIDLGEPANAIQNCGTSLPPSGSEGNLFNKYDTEMIYQWIGNSPGSWRNIGSNKYGLPLGNDALTFADISDPERLSAKLGLILVDGSSPILATDQGFVVKKDLSAGGFIATNQGEVWIGHGREDATDVPKIILDHAGIGYPTLYLRQRLWDSQLEDWTVTTPAHLDLGDLTVEGQLKLQSANRKLFTLAAGDNGEADNYVYLTPIDPPNGGLGLGTYAHPFQWIDTYTVFTDAIMNLHPLPRIALLLRLLSTSRSSGMKQASALDAEETVEAIVIDNDEVAGLKQKHLNGLVDEWYSDDEATLTAKVDGTTGSITANGGITLGTSPAAINFTTGYTTSEGTTYRYLIPDGADKTVGIGSTNHYLAYLSANRVYTNEILSLDAGYTIVGSALNANGTVGTAGQVLKSRGANLSPEWATASNPFNQSLNTTDNAIFNSVKVISADGDPAHGAAVKVGDSTHDYLALNYDGTYGYVSAHSRALYLSGDNGITIGSQLNGTTTEDAAFPQYNYGGSHYYGIGVKGAWHTIRTHWGAYGTRISKWDGTTLTDLFNLSNSGNLTLTGWLSTTAIATSGNIIANGNYIEINPASGNSYLDMRVNGVDSTAIGFNGTDSYVVAYRGNLMLQAPYGIVKTANNTLDDNAGNILVGQPCYLGFQVGSYGPNYGISFYNSTYGNMVFWLHEWGNQPWFSWRSARTATEWMHLDSSGNLGLSGSMTTNGNVNVVNATLYTNGIGVYNSSWITTYNSINPISSGSYSLGGGGNYWAGVVTNTIYRRNESSFDALDDLGLVKQYKTKRVIEHGVERDTIDIESLPHLKGDPTPTDTALSNFWDESKVSGFLLGCVKALAMKVEKLESQLKSLNDSKVDCDVRDSAEKGEE